jgi:hypothetical protein
MPWDAPCLSPCRLSSSFADANLALSNGLLLASAAPWMRNTLREQEIGDGLNFALDTSILVADPP